MELDADGTNLSSGVPADAAGGQLTRRFPSEDTWHAPCGSPQRAAMPWLGYGVRRAMTVSLRAAKRGGRLLAFERKQMSTDMT